MKKQLSLKVAKDMLWHQGSWTLAFLGIVLLIHIFNVVKGIMLGDEFDSYYHSVYVAGNIYMFVIGIISIYFLTHFVEHGVPRKKYFFGSLLAAVGLAMMIPLVSFVIFIIEQFFFHPTFKIMEINNIMTDIDDSIIGYIVGSFVVTPYVDPSEQWLLAIGVFSLNLFIYYIFGWLISASFHRFRTIGGLAFIAIGLLVVMFIDTCLRYTLQLPIAKWFVLINTFSNSLAAILILFLIACILVTIRLITSRAPIKI